MVQNKNKILLHACCAICSGYPISLLKELGYEVVVYFYNPNLDSEKEFQRRLDAQKTVCKYFDVPLIIEDYKPIEYPQLWKDFLPCMSVLDYIFNCGYDWDYVLREVKKLNDVCIR